MKIQRVGVIGAGTMGNGIAHVFARGGYGVVLCDIEQKFLDRGLANIAKNLEREVKFRVQARNKASASGQLSAPGRRSQSKPIRRAVDSALPSMGRDSTESA